MQVLVNSVGSSHASSPPQEYLFVIGNTGIMDWRFLRECGLTNSVDAADLTGSGISNVIMGSRSSRVCAIKDEHRDRSPLIWSYAAGNPVEHIMADDFTADEESEVAGYAGRYMQGKLFMLDSNGNEMWSDDISGGVFTGINPSDVIKSASLSADGSKSIVIGTFNSGLIAYSANGKRLWDFETGNLISAVAAYDINKDGYDEIIVGSAPNVYILDRNGKEIGRFRGDSEQTIYSISAADIDKDGKKEIAIGATRSIYVIDHEGTMLGQWRYTVEIQGVEKTADERAADAVSVVMTDLDSDGMPEIVAVWNWEQSTIRGNQYSATLIVYEINPEYALTKEQKETEKPGIKQTTTTKKAQVVETTTTVPAAIIDVDEDADEEADGGICCMPFLPAILAAALALFMRVPMAADR